MAALYWELVKQDGNVGTRLRRAKVPGGWFVHTTAVDNPTSIMVFYPDPEHAWDVDLEADRSMPEGRGWDRR